MTTHLVTFSDESMSRARELCATSAMNHGCQIADAHSTFTLERMTDFHADWANLRGVGYWHWKPVIIREAMKEREDGDILIYSDAGIEFIDNVSHIIDRMDQDIFLFGNNWEHAHWCKRDVVDAISPLDYVMAHWPRRYQEAGYALALGDRPNTIAWENFGKQCQASVIFFRVSDYTRTFVAEWLKWCLFEGGRLIDDSPSRLPNHPEFREHRHDQAILTTLAYREGIKLHYWPAQYNDGAFNYEKLPEYAGDDYPILFHHHRRRNIDWEQGRIRFSALARQQTGCA